MDIEKLKKLKQQIKGVHDGINGDDLNLLYDLLPLVDEAIGRESVENWVSVEDRLPDGDVASVLVYTNKGGVSEGQYYPSIKSWKQFRWSVENANVTHWKPLPAPPKEVIDDQT